MSEDRKPASKPEDKTPADATPHNPGLSPKPGDAGESKPAAGAPYEKNEDPAQQPS